MAKLVPNYQHKRFEIEVHTGVSTDEMKTADKGTVQEGAMVYQLDGKTYRTPIKTLRGDYRDTEGNTRNRLRRWEKTDFKPAPDDIFQERLYAIQWIAKATLDQSRKETFFASVTKADRQRERQVEEIVKQNLTQWQAEGLVPDMEIEPGDKTNEPIRTRGWTHWHHLFTSRQILFFSQFSSHTRTSNPATLLQVPKALDRSSKLCRWHPSSPGKPGVAPSADKVEQVFDNQAFNTHYSYAAKSSTELLAYLDRYDRRFEEIKSTSIVSTCPITVCSV